MKSSQAKVATLSRPLLLALWIMEERQSRFFIETVKRLNSHAGWRDLQAIAEKTLEQKARAGSVVVEVPLCADSVDAIGGVLQSVGIDRSEVASVVRTTTLETVSGIGFDAGYIAESYVYPNRAAAIRGAAMLHAKYRGSDGHTLQFKQRGRVVAQWFPNRKRKSRK